MKDWRTYDDVAETYERVHAPRFVDVARDLVELAGIDGDMRVLDVGTGTGIAAAAALERLGPGGSVLGIDGSPGMLAVAARVRPTVQTVAAEAIDLPIRDGVFDGVLGNFVLAHFAKVETALFDLIRVLRPGGRLALSAWADRPDMFQTSFLEQVGSVVPKELLAPAWNDVIPGRERFTDRHALEEVLIDAGLRHVRTEVRSYRWVYTQEEYLAGLEVFATGRFVRSMLGEDGWAAFTDRVRTVFASEFADPMNDVRDVLLAVATKP